MFAGGTNQWSWGLGPHFLDQPGFSTYLDSPVNSADSRIEQATYNVLADMGSQPNTPAGVSLDGNDAPVASFTLAPNPAQTGQTVNFNGSGSSDTEGPITRYQWDLDGNGSFETDTGTTPTASRSYATEGTVAVRLRVTDAGGLTGETTRTLTVGTGLVAAYGFDEASGAAVGDASGRGNAGTIAGATRTASGRYGGALSFDGVNDWVSVADSASLDLTDGMTLEAWVNPSAQSSWRTALLKEAPGDLVYALYSSSAYGGVGAARPSSWLNGNADLGAATALPTGQWSHVATTYDRNTWRLYVNGTQVASRSFTSAISPSNGFLRIGGNSVWGEYFGGGIDEVRVYSRALTALEVAADRDTPISGGPPPPDTTPPTVSVSGPSAGATLAGNVAVSASASDNVGVAGVQFRVDGQALGAEDTSAPYSVNWNTTGATNGSHTITAVARDAAGNTTTSTAVNVTSTTLRPR